MTSFQALLPSTQLQMISQSEDECSSFALGTCLKIILHLSYFPHRMLCLLFQLIDLFCFLHPPALPFQGENKNKIEKNAKNLFYFDLFNHKSLLCVFSNDQLNNYDWPFKCSRSSYSFNIALPQLCQ